MAMDTNKLAALAEIQSNLRSATEAVNDMVDMVIAEDDETAEYEEAFASLQVDARRAIELADELEEEEAEGDDVSEDGDDEADDEDAA